MVNENTISLRDWFAGMALVGQLHAMTNEDAATEAIAAAKIAGRNTQGQLAFSAYKMADAMLAERAKGIADA